VEDIGRRKGSPQVKQAGCRVRNPIFTAMTITGFGVSAIVGNVVAVVGLFGRARRARAGWTNDAHRRRVLLLFCDGRLGASKTPGPGCANSQTRMQTSVNSVR
jgi:hypothetical protein